KCPRKCPRLSEHVWVFDGQIVLDGLEVRPPETLRHVKVLGMSVTLELRLIVETDGIHDQRIALPMAGGITQPAWIGINRMRTSIGGYDAEGSRIFVKDRDVVRALKNLKLIRHAPGLRRNQRHAVRCRAGIVRPTDDTELLCTCFQHRSSGRGA